jgi:hypothetical protein
VQESSENLLAANAAAAAAAASPRVRGRSGLGARFMLLVGGGRKSGQDHSKENKASGQVAGAEKASGASSTKITKYFHLHRKLCLPLFKPAAAAPTANSTSGESGVVWIPDKT